MQKRDQLHEKNKYSDQAFPVGMYSVSKGSIQPPGRGFQDLHWHEELQFTLVLSGSVTMQLYDRVYVLQAGEGLFINRGLLHVTADMSEAATYVSINFPEKMLGFFAGSRMEKKYVTPYTSNLGLIAVHLKEDLLWQADLLEKLEAVRLLLDTSIDKRNEYKIALSILEIWQVFIEHVDSEIIAPRPSSVKRQQRLQTFIAYIHDHFDEDIKLKDIASAAHVSEGECGRCFKSMLNMTPYDYLLNYRISQSIDLLNGSEMSITEIALAVGFNDVSHFIQVFKRKIGITPKQYK